MKIKVTSPIRTVIFVVYILGFLGIVIYGLSIS